MAAFLSAAGFKSGKRFRTAETGQVGSRPEPSRQAVSFAFAVGKT